MAKLVFKKNRNSVELTLDGEPVKLEHLRNVKLDATAGELGKLTLEYSVSEFEIEHDNVETVEDVCGFYDGAESTRSEESIFIKSLFANPLRLKKAKFRFYLFVWKLGFPPTSPSVWLKYERPEKDMTVKELWNWCKE